MSKEIKKHIKRTMPLFVIFCLLFSTTMFGLAFNFDFKLVKINEKLGISIGSKEAQADTASTTVTVRNAAPVITSGPAENPVSSSTSPVNVGGSIGFTARASDVENNNFYLIVCTDNAGVTPGVNGAAPTCDNGINATFCVSASTTPNTDASCTYNNVRDPGAETDDWFAYVCDDHASEADCSPLSQGSGDSGSPIWINHAPGFTAVDTTIDDQDPGGTFQITATVSDADTEGGADVLSLYVCQTNSWSTSTGCASNEYCHGTSTGASVACSFATSTPAVDGAYTYYAFVKDWHDMPSAANSRNNTYTVNNVAPTVSNVIINSGVNINPNIKNATEIVASSSARISDNNGCTDIVDATSTIYWENASGGSYCSGNDNDCYPIGLTSCQLIAGSCSGPSSAQADYICTTTIAFHAIPTDASSGNPATSWYAAVRGFDEVLSGQAISASGVDVKTNSALEVTETEIPYGTIRGGEDSGAYNATTTIVNFGNSPINTNIVGDDMVRDGGGGTIAATYQEYDLGNFTYGGASWSLVNSGAPDRNIICPKPTDQNNVSDQVFWGIGVPGGTISGNYSGTNYFTVVIDATDW